MVEDTLTEPEFLDSVVAIFKSKIYFGEVYLNHILFHIQFETHFESDRTQSKT